MKKYTVTLALLGALISGCGTTIDRDANETKPATNTPKTDDKNSAGVPNTNPNTGKVEDKISLPKITHNNENYQILAWNDLGMHCMDGNDYSVFSILPPYNNLLTQLIKKGVGGSTYLVESDVKVTYQAVASFDGKYNTSSANKTNFWQYIPMLFNKNVADDIGLAGNPVQSFTPAPLEFNENKKWWSAEGIPTVPINNDGTKNEYPMVRVLAKDNEGKVLAETITTLPVSDEMDCKKCHSTDANNAAAKPLKGYVNMEDKNRDYKYNILRLHDQKHTISTYVSKLKESGYNYENSLEKTAQNGTPILCATCHKSNALGTKGFSDIPSLTSAIHSKHANTIDPITKKSLNDSTNRDSCYSCHPGKSTQCLRGAMGKAEDENGTLQMQCQSCHGSMKAVGAHDREGWLDQPNCQVCHQDGKRYKSAVIDPDKGTLRAVLDNKFATNPNTPVAGKSLYRYSTGHGKLQCAACHGSTHAIYGSSRDEDNIQSKSAQGHAGTIGECTSCHTSMPETEHGGPHGMHPVGIDWVHGHQEAIYGGTESCKACHGKDYKGSPLSKMFKDRSLGGREFKKGKEVSCYDCHNGPTGINY